MSENAKEKLNEAENSYLEKIRIAATNIDFLVNDLLNLSKINQVDLDLHSINLTSLCREIIEEINKSNSSPNLELNLQSGMSIYADPGLIRIVMKNLLITQ